MSNSDDYRHKAAECLRTAEITTELAARVVLLDMAQSWRRLAEQAEQNDKNDMVYQTPPAQEPIVLQQQQRQPKE